jgi:CBS-domain-containing membrane protein
VLTTTENLLELTAAQLMSRDVIVIPERMSLRGAAGLLRQAAVSGAPVVDPEGCCTGVLSATDFLRRAEGAVPAAVLPCPCGQDLHSDWEIIDVEPVPGDEVRAFMTRDAVTVGPDAGIGELARMMLDAHIHRVIVTDAVGRPIGIVSSTDILAAVARASQEANSANSAS